MVIALNFKGAWDRVILRISDSTRVIGFVWREGLERQSSIHKLIQTYFFKSILLL